MAKYIDKAAFVGERLTSSEQQLRFREMTGAEAYNEFLRLVNEMPAADVEPVVHGRWEHVDQRFYFGEFEDVFRCSACGGETHHEYEFCPVCGAKMGGSGDG